MRVLLDTHALLWWATDAQALTRKVRRAIGDDANEIYVSAASAWEIATKARLGKLEWAPEAGSIRDYVVAQGFRPLPIALAHGERAGALAGQHKDPFDRMLIAQALAEGLLLASNEELFDSFGVTRLW